MLRNTLRIAAAAAVNLGLFSVGLAEARKNHQYYLNLPESERKKLYNNCPTQKYGSAGDALSAINERTLTSDPQSHASDMPKIPYPKR